MQARASSIWMSVFIFKVAFVVVVLKKVSLKKVWLVGYRYVFGKNYGWSLCVAKNMYKMFGGSVVALAFQSAFYLLF